MPQTAEQVLQDLKQQRYAPVYFLQGEEPYYIDLIADYIEKNALQESERGFNQLVVYGKDVEVNTIITHAKRYPMMSERQVVIVKEAQDIQDIQSQNGQLLLESYIKNPLPSTILVFCYKYKTLDKRKALAKAVGKFAVQVDASKLYDNQVPDWINRYVRQRGFKIENEAVQMLADYIGNNLQRLSNEVEKILVNFREDSEALINADLVQKYVGISKEYNVFELQKALATKDVLKANQIVQYFEANLKANPIIPVIALLFAFYSKLLLVHQSTDKTERGLAGLLKINPFFAKEYRAAAFNYPLPKVIQNIHYLRLADMHAKGIDNAGGSDAQILKELVFKLIH